MTASLAIAWPVPVAVVALGYVGGAALVIAGMWMISGAKARLDGERDAADGTGLAAWRDRQTVPTRYAMGVTGLILGYHAVSYVSPSGWLGLRVPPEWWWLVVGAAAVTVVGSLLLDRVVGEPPDKRGA